ncbi:hypothetical protein Cabys_2669 [Caldithrix abyssi DSM 13497]|uniref:Uncharacterized protein n=1 Tax=Caldithrix abyssi DSM 13497 TaxID=880073 RepID=A0A1J1CAW9_CALAY|nr:hypothetical protein Cabys_2669 [Caldithrix abyssi DSM 13497]
MPGGKCWKNFLNKVFESNEWLIPFRAVKRQQECGGSDRSRNGIEKFSMTLLAR